jgi:hypothetical protein
VTCAPSVFELARPPDARVEDLAPFAVDVAAMRFEEIPTTVGEDDERLAMAFEVNGLHESGVAQVAQIATACVGRTTVVIAKRSPAETTRKAPTVASVRPSLLAW